MKKLFVLGMVCLAFLIGSLAAEARDYDKELRDCLVQSASPKDAVILALWSGLAMTQHTAVAPLVNISEKEFLKITKEAGDVYVRLGGVMCLDETFNALKHVGPNALNNGLDYLVSVRSAENYSDAGTRKAIALFNAYTEDELYGTLLNLIGSPVDKPIDEKINYEYELKKCLLQSATPKDTVILALWSGLIMTQHTAVASMGIVSEKEFLRITEAAGDVYLRLTCEMCLNETFNALKHGGDNTLGNSFAWLEEVSKPGIDSDSGIQKALTLFHTCTSETLFDLLKQYFERYQGRN
ncbi:hypothetical protein [Halodesulfovibrio marinisediminis]|uniref:Uncharacterized protein n=1 Tax=Halodesulfovibrio marinisediminis DSM 17456 TaxID=1121457 RepID=A0A1N6I046_9BACT|nr:hypothetical protein [Halodesulfovibrio marinisediminis]SIO25402.1 hypothetical protein SAMN02745161_2314 [Halodesulfovibrio marinisediminis DSM 17456]